MQSTLSFEASANETGATHRDEVVRVQQPTVRLELIHLQNFKSFRGVHLIRLSGFDAIVGSNGAGKSNLLDAVAFVAGETNPQTMRVRYLSDLIHKGLANEVAVAESCSVGVKFSGEDGTEDIIFERIISLNGSSTYLWNSHQVERKVYMAEIEKLNINMKSKHFLLMQGTVSNISLMNQEKLMRFFETTCGSIQYKAEYDRLSATIADLQKQYVFQSQMKNKYAKEISYFKILKKETEKVHKMEEDRNKLFIEYALCNIHHLNNKLKSLDEPINEERFVYSRLDKEREGLILQKVNIAKQQSAMNEVIEKTDLKVTKQKQLIDETKLTLFQTEEENAFNRRRTKTTDKKIENVKAKLDENERAFAACKLELGDVQRQLTLTEIELDQVDDIEFNTQQTDEYHQLKNAFLRQTAREQKEIDNYQLAETNLDLNFLRMQTNILNERVTQLRERHNAEQKKQTEINSQLTSIREEMERYEELVHANNSDALNKVSRDLNSKITELQTVKTKLSMQEYQAGVDKKLEAETKAMELLQSSNSGVSGTVVGRLRDLIQIKDQYKKFHLAILRVIGPHMNSIVVATTESAMKCITILRSNRLDRETFLPLDSIYGPEPSATLSSIPNGILVSLMLTFNDICREAVLYACDNAVAFHTPREASIVSKDVGKLINAVAICGTYYNKHGLIIGGQNSLEQRAERMSIPSLLKKQDKLTADIKKLTQEKRELQMTLDEHKFAITGFKKQLEVLKQQDKASRSESQKIQRDVTVVNQDFQEYSNQLDLLVNQAESFSRHRAALQITVDAIENDLFEDFCTRNNLENIKRYEQCLIPAKEAQQFKCMQLRNQIDHLTEAIQLRQDEIKKASRDLESLTKAKKKLMDSLSLAPNAVNLINETLLEQTRRLNKYLTYEQSLAENQKAQKHELEKLEKDFSTLKMQMDQSFQVYKNLEDEKQVVIATRHHYFTQCQNRLVTLPVKRDSQEPLTQLSDDSLLLEERYNLESKIHLDYSTMHRGLRDLTEARLEEVNQEFIETIENMDTAIADNRRQLKCLPTTLEELKERLHTHKLQFTELGKQLKEVNNEFLEVKTKRLELINNCLTRVSHSIDAIYKELNENSANAFAAICAVNPEEPYLGGLSYICKVSNKTMINLQFLSGGEQSIASLALFYATLASAPPPICIFDEADAALDGVHARKWANFLVSRHQKNDKIMVISHNIRVISNFDNITGILREPHADGNRTTQVISCNLAE